MKDKAKKLQKLKPRLPRGLVDHGPAELAATRAMVERIRRVYERYGFEPVETPAMEYTDALGKFLPDQDRPNEGVFSFQDDDEQWVSLRYDLTAPLARYVAERYGTESLVLPYRSYRHGWVFRNEKPGPGRFRQFMQFDADTVGSASPAADAEICMMAADTMEALGIPRGNYIVKLNSRKVLDGVLESIGLGGQENAGARLTVLRAIDKLDKFPAAEVKKLLGTGRWDGGEEGKGDFTKGAGLSPQQIDLVVQFAGGHNESWEFVTTKSSPPTNDEIMNSVHEFARRAQLNVVEQPSNSLGNLFFSNRAILENWRSQLAGSPTAMQGIAELQEIVNIAQESGYGSQRIQIASEVVRGLEYYTGPVFEVELTLKDEKGHPARFGSVGGGGRYDGLVSRFRGEPVPATGFSIGVSRLHAALKTLGAIDIKPEFGPVVVAVFDKSQIAQYQKLVTTLRNSPIDPKFPNGPRIHAELFLGNAKNMATQFKYADKRNSPCVVIQGPEEQQDGFVQVKDMIIGAELGRLSEDHDDYRRRQQEAQVVTRVEWLVEHVREVLARHDVSWG